VNNVNPQPKFDNPPVVETILGVHFQRLEGFNSAHQGILWEQCFRQHFPAIEERGPVDEVRELFGEERKVVPAMRWEISGQPATPRLWVASPTGEHILQIQRDGLLANWLKPDDAAEYRPYDCRRADFQRNIEQLDAYVQKENIGKVVPTSCTVTYINHLPCDALDNFSPALAEAITFWSDTSSDDWLPPPDRIDLRLTFPMPEQSGRLNVHIKPAIRRSDQQVVLRMDLTARGTVRDGTLAAAMDWIDLGHEWIVRGFASITHKEMHQLWERTQ